MDINLHMSSIQAMLKFLRDLRLGQASRQQLTDLFNHPDYDFEFRRYEIVSKEHIVDYFMQIHCIDYNEIPLISLERKRAMLKHKHKFWLEAYENPGEYDLLYDKVHSFLSDDVLEDIYKLVKNGLPTNIFIGSRKIISTMSIGTSFGYVFDGALHFDLMGLKNTSLDILPSLIAHEIHHLAFEDYISVFMNRLTLEERYILEFSGEGLAVKFCNNAKGTISKPIYDNRPINDGLDDFSMNYLNERFDEALKVFEDTLFKIRTGKMNEYDVSKQFRDYWMNLHTEDQDNNDEPRLKQSLIYSFGNDLFGSIYDVFGTEILFDCIRNPLKTIEYFKTSIKKACTRRCLKIH